MIRLIPISPPRQQADDVLRIPLLEPHQWPPGVPLDQCFSQDVEAALIPKSSFERELRRRAALRDKSPGTS